MNLLTAIRPFKLENGSQGSVDTILQLEPPADDREPDQPDFRVQPIGDISSNPGNSSLLPSGDLYVCIYFQFPTKSEAINK